jgi:PTS system nitrogen regulatory IIA component
MKLSDYLDLEGICTDLKPKGKLDLLATLADRVAARHPAVEREVLLERLAAREEQGSTGIGQAVAVPHAMIEGIGQTICIIAHLSEAVDFGGIDGEPVRLVFLLISPPKEIGRHIKLLARIARMMKSGEIQAAASRELSPRELYHMIQREDERHVE